MQESSEIVFSISNEGKISITLKNIPERCQIFFYTMITYMNSSMKKGIKIPMNNFPHKGLMFMIFCRFDAGKPG